MTRRKDIVRFTGAPDVVGGGGAANLAVAVVVLPVAVVVVIVVVVAAPAAAPAGGLAAVSKAAKVLPISLYSAAALASASAAAFVCPSAVVFELRKLSVFCTHDLLGEDFSLLDREGGVAEGVLAALESLAKSRAAFDGDMDSVVDAARLGGRLKDSERITCQSRRGSEGSLLQGSPSWSVGPCDADAHSRFVSFQQRERAL